MTVTTHPGGAMRRIQMYGADALEFDTDERGVILLRAEDEHGTVNVRIHREFRAGIEACWRSVATEQETCHAARAEEAARWLEERGHTTVRDLLAAEFVKAEEVLAFRDRHLAAVAERHASDTPVQQEDVVTCDVPDCDPEYHRTH